ncbi:glutathione S-transferase [Xanthomonas hortorum ATCC 19865]|nr:glutathione S-transferase [Xanthomonas hortorum ATCC 19865]
MVDPRQDQLHRRAITRLAVIAADAYAAPILRSAPRMPLPRLVIGDKTLSSWSLRPWLLLRHFQVPFEEIALPLDTPEFQARIAGYSPTRQVPVLWDGTLHVWDSLAICEYVNERWLDGRGWPADLAVRAQARAAAAEMHSGFAALRTQLPMDLARAPSPAHWDAAAERDITRIQALWASLRAEHGHAGQYLCGEFGIVDAMFAPVALRFASYGVPLFEAAGDYLAALDALPALREWKQGAVRERLGRH